METYLILKDGVRVGIVEDDGFGREIGDWFHRAGVPAARGIIPPGYSTEEGGPDCGAVADLIEGIAGRLGVTMTAAFVPFSASRNAKPEPARHGNAGKPWLSLNWRVTLQRYAASAPPERRDILTADYSQGVAYAPAHKARPRGGASRPNDRFVASLREKAIAAEIETGRVHEFGESSFMGRDGIRDTRKAIDAPPIGEVLQSLARDSDVIDAGGFENWASEFGYDPDSRTAESIYRACLEHALALRGHLGEANLAELRLAASFN